MTRVERIAQLRSEKKSWEQVGAALGCTAEAARCAFKKHKPESQHKEKCEDTEDATGRSLQYHGERIRTVEQLLEHAKVDTAIWEVIEQKVNTWEVAGKNHGEPGLWKTGLLQISVRLRRKAPKPIQDGIRELLKNVKPLAAKAPKRIKSTREQMLEVGLYDHHFGKLCWAQETGSSYDLKIAQTEFQDAIDAMLARVRGEGIEKIVFPLGNDFFHANDWQSNTANGTRVESTDDRFSKVFRVGCQSVQYAVERCLEVAPTDVLWVPGNHDRHTSWFLTEWLAAVFRGNKYLNVNNRAGNRKYVQYGVNLLGYTHGDELKPDKLPLIMAQEQAQAWAETKFRSWRTGHLHKRMETRFVAGDTHQGVEHRIFPSLCGTDSWHYSNGFCGNAKMAECHLHHKRFGPLGYHIIHGNQAAA